MEEQAENRNKRKLNIDWEEVLPGRNDDVPAELIVKKSGPPTPAQKSVPMSDDPGSGEELDRQIPDQELGVRIARMKDTYSKVRHCLPDKGKKILATVTRLEKECERRRLAGAVPVCLDIDGCDKLTQSPSSDASDCFTQRTPSPQIQSKSSFTSVFREKMEENRDCREANAFDKELSILAHCDRRKMRSDGDLSQRGRQKVRSSSRKWPFHKGDKSFNSNGSQKDRASLTCPSHQSGENSSSCLPKKKESFEVLPSKNPRLRKEQNLVLLDEDESPVEDASEESEGSLHIETTEQADEFAECMIDAKIYYPSRVDPESVEICYTDINHLAPAAYLTSPIMNFYIRYLQLQASPTNRAIRDCHFFNTYFYSKLKEAVSHKGGDKDSFFIKFRRWWKGVNIFQKSYVLIPIHEDVHWSLVIICIPDKEDESGPIILHLDSLKLHCSLSIFSNIRSFLKEEWNYLKQEVSPSDLPIAERIWQHLPRRIDDRIIPVPQQKNDYDCGLFVLFFMERFMEEAPERLKKKDLAMFGKRWFRPEEASGLRIKIRNLLKKQFQISSAECCNSKSLTSPGGCSP
ncbi:ubiquitin-like-specific protease 1D [Citrus sinensis]|uniref:ubiquitin-like-specific protease 1D isoform X1 n=1 Tax=Citrus sinensis TaxID=2711 RepID=UPI0003D7815D|nr:ubiquitin-like-specific protease 1D isoform X1 [Citrus sinensis]KAH9708963.1 ubiquitin-like-specific protease 1D [Citrus sinensis]